MANRKAIMSEARARAEAEIQSRTVSRANQLLADSTSARRKSLGGAAAATPAAAPPKAPTPESKAVVSRTEAVLAAAQTSRRKSLSGAAAAASPAPAPKEPAASKATVSRADGLLAAAQSARRKSVSGPAVPPASSPPPATDVVVSRADGLLRAAASARRKSLGGEAVAEPPASGGKNAGASSSSSSSSGVQARAPLSGSKRRGGGTAGRARAREDAQGMEEDGEGEEEMGALPAPAPVPKKQRTAVPAGASGRAAAAAQGYYFDSTPVVVGVAQQAFTHPTARGNGLPLAAKGEEEEDEDMLPVWGAADEAAVRRSVRGGAPAVQVHHHQQQQWQQHANAPAPPSSSTPAPTGILAKLLAPPPPTSALPAPATAPIGAGTGTRAAAGAPGTGLPVFRPAPRIPGGGAGAGRPQQLPGAQGSGTRRVPVSVLHHSPARPGTTGGGYNTGAASSCGAAASSSGGPLAGAAGALLSPGALAVGAPPALGGGRNVYAEGSAPRGRALVATAGQRESSPLPPHAPSPSSSSSVTSSSFYAPTGTPLFGGAYGSAMRGRRAALRPATTGHEYDDHDNGAEGDHPDAASGVGLVGAGAAPPPSPSLWKRSLDDAVRGWALGMSAACALLAVLVVATKAGVLGPPAPTSLVPMVEAWGGPPGQGLVSSLRNALVMRAPPGQLVDPNAATGASSSMGALATVATRTLVLPLLRSLGLTLDMAAAYSPALAMAFAAGVAAAVLM